jgi:hypothetical protein
VLEYFAYAHRPSAQWRASTNIYEKLFGKGYLDSNVFVKIFESWLIERRRLGALGAAVQHAPVVSGGMPIVCAGHDGCAFHYAQVSAKHHAHWCTTVKVHWCGHPERVQDALLHIMSTGRQRC